MIVRAIEKGCTKTAVAKAAGVSRQRVLQVLDQEKLREEMSEEDYDKLIMTFPPSGLTSSVLQDWFASQDLGKYAGRSQDRAL